MISFFKSAFFFSTIILICSCRETFDDKLPNSDINTLVVEGVINDGPGPYRVTLSRSVTLNSDKLVVVNNAEVYVLDDLNNRYDFKERTSGSYFSDVASFRGQMGRFYTLCINTSDSMKYRSTPCTIGPPSTIDSVYGYEETLYNLQINADISFKSNQRMSTKIDASIALETKIDSIWLLEGNELCFNDTCFINYDTSRIITKYYTTRSLSNVPIIKTNTDYVAGSKIKNIPLFDFYYPSKKIDTVVIDSMNFIVISRSLEFILVINASTISNETYNYYSDLFAQVGGKNTFFEPVPIQLIGNIKCINNNSKAAYGLFEANALTNKYFRIEQNSLYEVSGIPSATIDSSGFFTYYK
jgi:hypothetical protein